MSFLSTVWPILLLFGICILLIIVKIVRMIKISRDKTKRYKGDYILLGLVIGMSIGTLIGTLYDSKSGMGASIGMSLGTMVGMTIGMLIHKK